ncbi:MAG: type II toxin-antitoxin system VapC family toxin [Egibacteraceae bacterium]
MIFADTLFWIAWRNGRDPRHEEAARLLQRAGTPILTTNHVRGETWTYLRRKVGHDGAVQFLDVLERSARVTVRAVSPQYETEALAFDGDFTAAGFIELRL